MDIIIESPGFRASENLHSFIKEKLDKLSRHSERIIRADVTLYSGPDSDPASAHCEIRLHVPGNDHFVKKGAASYEQAVAETVDVLDKLIQSAKDKNISRRHNGEI